MLQHGIAQITGGDEPHRQLRDFAFLLFNNFVENVHGLINRQDAKNAKLFMI